MTPIVLKPTHTDRAVADFVAGHTSPALEEISSLLTLGGDEHLIFSTLAAAALFAAFGTSSERKSVAHLWIATLSVAAVSHALKRYVNQQRPDRTEAPFEGQGIPHSGGAYNAFPSGHAMYMGAIASTLSHQAPRFKVPIWIGAGLIALTRVVVLAHWLSDVLVGLAMGSALERLTRTESEETVKPPRR
ncbi:membrane protein [Labrys miyagiensis]|uniref:Membrane protein n=1 Tax=Labrys miyagiensis TaxID=346912 RepID=A0ABQ6CLC3_9HYPH|nr:phosphatase PAP2 family protein [Labrys miyagiensis]GLS20994.1 membrane protein [Labrys miyagiensis]